LGVSLITTNQIRHILTRVGAALVFMTFGIWEITKPAPWANYIPAFLTGIGGPLILVTIHGAIMLVVGIAILTGFYLKPFAILGSLVLLFIIVSLLTLTGYNDIIVRDAGLLLFVASLIFDKERYLAVTK
jgi:uncharacterized membrane protein YphA (DoxX/SURF4 family)